MTHMEARVSSALKRSGLRDRVRITVSENGRVIEVDAFREGLTSAQAREVVRQTGAGVPIRYFGLDGSCGWRAHLPKGVLLVIVTRPLGSLQFRRLVTA